MLSVFTSLKESREAPDEVIARIGIRVVIIDKYFWPTRGI